MQLKRSHGGAITCGLANYTFDMILTPNDVPLPSTAAVLTEESPVTLLVSTNVTTAVVKTVHSHTIARTSFMRIWFR